MDVSSRLVSNLNTAAYKWVGVMTCQDFLKILPIRLKLYKITYDYKSDYDKSDYPSPIWLNK